MDLSEILKPDKNKDLLRKLIITTLKNDYNINDININYNNIKNCNINYNNYKKKNQLNICVNKIYNVIN